MPGRVCNCRVVCRFWRSSDGKLLVDEIVAMPAKKLSGIHQVYRVNTLRLSIEVEGNELTLVHGATTVASNN